MYWLRWHYHVKDIAGPPYKIKKKSKQKRQRQQRRVRLRQWTVISVPYGTYGNGTSYVRRRQRDVTASLAAHRHQKPFSRLRPNPSPTLSSFFHSAFCVEVSTFSTAKLIVGSRAPASVVRDVLVGLGLLVTSKQLEISV